MADVKNQSDLIPCARNRILIVDDEKGIRDVFLAVVSFSIPDSRIDLATNGAEAVESFRECHHRIILLDLNMPVMNGLDAFTEIQSLCAEANWAKPSIIFCTGFDPPNALNAILSSGKDYLLLRKPVSNAVLVKSIKERLTD